MRRNRRSSPAWRLVKKAILLIIVLVGLRLVWLTLVRGRNPRESVVDIQIKDHTLNELQRWKSQQRNNYADSGNTNDEYDDNRKYDNSQNIHIENPDNDGHDDDEDDGEELPFEGIGLVSTAQRRKTTAKPRNVIQTATKLKPTKDKGALINEKTNKKQSNEAKMSSSKGSKNDTQVTGMIKPSKDEAKFLGGRFYDKDTNKRNGTLTDKFGSTNAGKQADTSQHNRGNVTGAKKFSENVGSKSPTKTQSHDDIFDGSCQQTVSWGQTYHAEVSTYDLVKFANYTTDEEGAYSIPTRKAVDIVKDPNLNHVNIVLVPFSHADPGYGMTMEGYYTQRTHYALNNMLVKLVKYPNMTFQWAETVFLARWFEDLNEREKEIARKLVKRGQLEIVLGGWVMPDEASTHYTSVIDQLIEGHQWLIENLGVKPRNAWVNDPFGYSSTMPYLWKASGMNNLVFLRIDQAVKAILMKRKSLDFKWRPYWKRDNTSDVLSTLMSYTNYWIADVCGPEPKVCNEFGFINEGTNQLVVEITADNVEQQSMKLYEQLRITADLYKYNTVYIGLGEDFSFTREQEWDNLYKNYEKIIAFFDSRKDLKMKIRFGTLADYFAHIRREEKRKQEAARTSQKNGEFPTLSGDFFPYTEKNNEYWTGYFSTRPMNKRFSREIEGLVRAVDIFNVIAYSMFKHDDVEYTGYRDVTENLRTARRELGMFLHHDGITGTSLPFVIEDFEMRLMRAFKAVNEAFKTVLSSLLSTGKKQTPEALQEVVTKPVATVVARHTVLDSAQSAKIILVNSLPRRRRQLVSVFVNSTNFKIESPGQPSLPQQITSFLGTNKHVRVTFQVDLPAFGIDVYNFHPVPGSHGYKVKEEDISEVAGDDTFSIRNRYFTIYFDKKTGMMKKVTDKSGRSTSVVARFYVYKAVKSGAYIFGPAGPAEDLQLDSVSVKISHGTLMSEVKVVARGISHSVKLYNITGLQGQGIFITNEIDMAAMNLKESEVVLRFETDMKNGNNFYTDQNGYQMMGRKTNMSKKIEANYYPISTMAILEDTNKRFNLHSRQPHGVASLAQGEIEIMLDRHTHRDDGRGLGQGYYQNVNVNSDFVLQFEYKTSVRSIQEVRYTYPTQDSSLLNERLQNDIFIYSIVEGSKFPLTKLHPLKTSQFPCDVTIVGMRNLAKNDISYNGTSLVLHRKSFECGYQSVTKPCSGKHKLTIRDLLPKLKADIVETTLSHLDNISTLHVDSDIKPDHMELRAFRIQV